LALNIVRVLHADFAGDFGEHPDSLAFAESAGGVIAETAVGDYRVEEAKALLVLNGLIRIADHA
jgi:hypothetical protein